MGEYKKDFDGWSERKKKLNLESKTPYFEEREIWWCALGVNVGFEQDGTSYSYRRPVLILKKWSPDTCLIVPLTSSQNQHPHRFSIGTVLGVESYVVISQMKTIDVKRFGEKMTTLDQEYFERMRKTIRDCL